MFVDAELPEDCRGRWETFVDQTLSETNRRNTIDLVSLHAFKYIIDDCNYTLKLKVWPLWWFFLVQIGTGHPRPSSEDDMESPFPKELTLQQVGGCWQLRAFSSRDLS